MTQQLTRAQLQAFLAIVFAILIVSIAPIVVTGINYSSQAQSSLFRIFSIVLRSMP